MNERGRIGVQVHQASSKIGHPFGIDSQGRPSVDSFGPQDTLVNQREQGAIRTFRAHPHVRGRSKRESGKDPAQAPLPGFVV